MAPKRFLLFAYNTCYPSGGWNDFVEAFDSIEAAEKAGLESDAYYWHIVNLISLKTVMEGMKLSFAKARNIKVEKAKKNIDGRTQWGRGEPT